jgi:hypothetical protein
MIVSFNQEFLVSDIYKYAAQNLLRFPSARGDLMVEQLFQVPLRSANGFDLDTIAKEINSELKGVSEESFVEDPTSNPRKQRLTVSLDIVKDVIATKQLAGKEARLKAERNTERAKILDIMAAKQNETLSQASLAELKQRLDALAAMES